MQYCTKCGNALADEAMFCTKCGCATAMNPNARRTKFCTTCGNQILEEAVVCPKCGCACASQPSSIEPTTLKTVAWIFMIISTVIMGFWLIPLAWTIPMTMYYRDAMNTNRPVSVGFKVCTLLFVSLVAGILMLCDNEQ